MQRELRQRDLVDVEVLLLAGTVQMVFKRFVSFRHLQIDHNIKRLSCRKKVYKLSVVPNLNIVFLVILWSMIIIL